MTLIIWLAIPLVAVLVFRYTCKRPMGGTRPVLGARHRPPVRLTAQQRRFEWEMFECGLDRHAIPGSDGQHHRVSADCPCAPGDAPVKHLDHTYGQLYVHHQTPVSQRA